MSALLFGAALLAAGVTVWASFRKYIWDSAVRFDLSP